MLLSGSVLVTGINLGYNLLVARFLGPKGFGHATVVYTLLTLISAVTLSFQIISAKLIAQQTTPEERAAVYRVFHRSSWVAGLFAASLLVSFRYQIAAYLHLPSSFLIVLLAVGAAFYVPLGSRRGYIQGAYGFRLLATNLVLEGAARLGGSLILIALGFGVTGVVGANAAGMAVAWLAIPPQKCARIANPPHLQYAFRETMHALVFFSGQVLINNCGIVLVKHFFSPRSAGIYAAIAMVGRVILSFALAVVNSMFPIAAGLREEDRKSLSLIATSLLLVLIIGCTITAALRMIPGGLWATLFGAGFYVPGSHGIQYLLAWYAASTVIYSLSVVIITYEMSYKIANSSWLQLIFSGLLIAGIARFHSTLSEVIVVQVVLMAALLVTVAIPFLLSVVNNSRTDASIGPRSMRFIRRMSEDEAIAEFLMSDCGTPAYAEYQDKVNALVFSPDFGNENENLQRRTLLFLRHGSLWRELPPQTKWYEVEIKANDLNQIRVFPRAHWRKITRGSFLITDVIERMRGRGDVGTAQFHEKIASLRRRLHLEKPIPGAVLLIGSDETAPLTILDGNHRFVAAALENEVHRLRFVCGLTPRMTKCCWYRTNLFTLSRYGRNLLYHLTHHPKAELEKLFENAS